MRKTKQKLFVLSLALVSLMAICVGCTAIAGASAELYLSPATKTVNIGDTFNVDVLVNTSGQNVVVVTAYLHYDPTKLEVVSINTSNSVFTMEIEKTADPSTGEIKITLVKPTPGANTASGNVATINFKALVQASPAYVTFVMTSPGATGDSDIILDDGKGTDILGSVKNGTYFIGGETRLNAELSLSPTTKAVGIGETFSVDVLVNTNGQNVVAAYLNYDTTKLEVVNIDTSNSVFTIEAEKTFDPSTGKIKITLGKPTPGVNTSRGNVATINFKAMAQASPANVTFVFTGFGASDDSGIYNESGGSDILSSVKNGAYFIVGENQPQNASFIYSPLNPAVNEEITFDASLSTDLDGMIKSWEWDFGDGSYGNGVIITHAYSTVGNYKVTLTVTDNDDAKNLTSKTIQVRLPPIYVPDDYPTIQWAVDNATGGDTIIVRDGLYTENIDVKKPHLTIKSENGPENCVVQAANSSDNVFTVTADYVNISSFTVTGATGANPYYCAGIRVDNADHCNISDNFVTNNCLGIYLNSSNNNTFTNNIASNNWYGICLSSSSNNTFSNNSANSNSYYGVYLYFSSSNTFMNNSANANNDDGIYLRSSSNNTFMNNSANTNNDDGIYLRYSNSNMFSNNNASNNDDGIGLGYFSNNNTFMNNSANTNNDDGVYLYFSSSNTFSNNNANSNNEEGILLYSSSSNTFLNNNASNNRYGIRLSSSNSNTFSNNNANSNTDKGIHLYSSSSNTFSSNTANSNSHGIYLGSSSNNAITNNNANSNNHFGIYLYYSSDNTIYLNDFINNTNNVYFYDSANIWNSTEEITYTYNGSQCTNYIGNYWDDYKGKYPAAEEIGSTGIWDMPYRINSDMDNYPLMDRAENYFVSTENFFQAGNVICNCG